MKKSITYFTRVCLIFALTSFGVAHALTLDEALAAAYEFNPDLKAQREEVKVRNESVMQALSQWLPDVSMNISRSKAHSVFTKPEQFNGAPEPMSSLNRSGTTSSITVQQNLFRAGGSIAAVKAAKHAVEASRSALLSKEQSIFINVVNQYLQVSQWEELHKALEKLEKQMKNHLVGIKAHFKLGQKITKTDVAMTESSLAEIIGARAQAYSSYRTAISAFTSTVGVEPVNLSIPHTLITLPASEEESITLAMSQNHDLIANLNGYKMRNSEVWQYIAPLFPSVDIGYTFKDNTKAQDMFKYSNSAATKNDSSLNLSVTIPIFTQGGVNWSRAREAKRREKQTKYSLESVRNEIKTRAVQAWQNLVYAKASLEANTLKLKAASLALEGALAESRAGLRSPLEVVQVSTNYYVASRNFLDARTQHYIALYTLKSVIGECTAKHLGLKVALYDPVKSYNQTKWKILSAYTND
jgi:TolC family type I secretion outer membrane protein